MYYHIYVKEKFTEMCNGLHTALKDVYYYHVFISTVNATPPLEEY